MDVRGSRPSGDAGFQYALVRDLFASRFGIQESDTAEVKRSKFENGMEIFLGAGEESRTTAHMLGQLIGFDFSASSIVKPMLGNPRQIRTGLCATRPSSCAGLPRSCPPSSARGHSLGGSRIAGLRGSGHARVRGSEAVRSVPGATQSARASPLVGEGMAHHERIDLRPLTKRQSRQLVEEILRQSESVPEVLRVRWSSEVLKETHFTSKSSSRCSSTRA